jgi:hypothetical protein
MELSGNVTLKPFFLSFISESRENTRLHSRGMVAKNFWVDHIYPEDLEYTVNYCTLNANESLNHDFEYRMVAKKRNNCLAEGYVSVVLKMIKP